MGEGIGDQQRRAPRWDVFRPGDTNPEQRPRNQPKPKSDHKVGKPRGDHWPDTFGGSRCALRSHSAFVPSRITATESAGRASITAAMTDCGTGMKPILQENSCTDRAKVMVSNSR